MNDGRDAGRGLSQRPIRSILFRKYITVIASVVCLAMLATGASEIWISYKDHEASLVLVQRQEAQAAAARIGQFIAEIEGQIGWTTQLPWSDATLDEQRYDALRLLRQVPAISELSRLDPLGHERLHVSRLSVSQIGGDVDRSHDAAFVAASAGKPYYGPVRFVNDSEPYMTLAMGGSGRDAGVTVAEVNLTLIWEVVSRIKVGERGQAYVVDSAGRLIAHPDISLVLRNSDLSHLPLLQAASSDLSDLHQEASAATDMLGRRVLTAHAAVDPLGWLVFVDLPLQEAYAPIYQSLRRGGTLLLAGLLLALLASLALARRMVTPIRALQTGAAEIGAGALTHRIDIATGDELEELGAQFNAMAARLEDSYATLEGKVAERTQQLELASLAKSRFLAAASHDLRQPLHALGLLFGQLVDISDDGERRKTLAQIDAAITDMNGLFKSLLDISKLDGGGLVPELRDFPLDPLLWRISATFAEAADERSLRLRVLPSDAWVRSDRVLLERILLNLVANAIRYTDRGGVIIGCRHRAGRLRIEVWDSGIGIPADQWGNIFVEFFRLAPDKSERGGGLGLGLAIVDRLCRLLDHPLELTSTPGLGSRFTVILPRVTPRDRTAQLVAETMASCIDKLIVVIDDDPMVLDAMVVLLRGWGCTVVAASSASAAMAELLRRDQRPDLIISDYHLCGENGVAAIARLRSAFGNGIAAFLVSADIRAERIEEASAAGLTLLHKPVLPSALRERLVSMLSLPEYVPADF